jgi:hypothetical protein
MIVPARLAFFVAEGIKAMAKQQADSDKNKKKGERKGITLTMPASFATPLVTHSQDEQERSLGVKDGKVLKDSEWEAEFSSSAAAATNEES